MHLKSPNSYGKASGTKRFHAGIESCPDQQYFLTLTTHSMTFHQQITQYRPLLLGYAKALCRDEDYAEDLVQNTYVAAIRFESTFQPGSNAKAWLKTILYNDFVNGFRKARKESGRVHYDVEFLSGHASFTVDRHEIGDPVREALYQLTPRDRNVAIMCFIQGYTYEEISQIIDVPLGTVRSCVSTTRKRLQRSLANYQRA
jgi:RNA polymerase sigma-70 factor (ECF subfamily)